MFTRVADNAGDCFACGASEHEGHKPGCVFEWHRVKESGYSCTCDHGRKGPIVADCSHIRDAREHIRWMVRQYDLSRPRDLYTEMVTAMYDGDWV